jgi:hypothetical protein
MPDTQRPGRQTASARRGDDPALLRDNVTMDAGKQQGASRRRHTRVAVRCPVTLTLASGAERKGTTVDLSADGLSLSTDQPISPGSRCRVHLAALPCRGGIRPLQLDARASYSSYSGPGSFRVGMVFVEPDAESESLLADLVA